MPNVYMKETPRVQTVNADGLGVNPATPVESVEMMSGNIRGVKETSLPVGCIPNPVGSGDGAVLEMRDSSWNGSSALKVQTLISDTQTVLSSHILTKRVAEGTKLGLDFKTTKFAAIIAVGEIDGKPCISGIFSSAPYSMMNCHSYLLTSLDSEDDPYELTLENAPNKKEFTIIDPTALDFKVRFRQRWSGHHDVMDLRLCLVCGDDDGNEVERIYSAQSRFTFNNGVITKTKVNTIPTSPEHIVDVGLFYPTGSAGSTFTLWLPPNYEGIGNLFFPLLNYTYAYDLIIPDSIFENSINGGVGVYVERGDGAVCVTPSIYKAEYGFLTPPTGDGTYTMQVVVTDGAPTFSWVEQS